MLRPGVLRRYMAQRWKEALPMVDQSASDVIDRFYDSAAQKNDAWKELWADDAVFRDASDTLRAEGKSAVIQSFVPFLKGVAMLKVLQRIVEGDSACYVVSYDYVNPKGERMHQDDAEVWEVRNGKLAKLTIYFDLTVYRNFMRR